MARMWSRFTECGAAAMVTVYSNRDGYSRSSVRVGADGFVDVFDRSRTSPNLEGIEIGYAVITEEALAVLPEEDALFEEAVYPALARTRRLAAFVSDHRYYGVGSPARLPETEAFLARRPAVLLDRDGVLNERPARGEYVRAPGEFRWLPGAREALRLLAEAGYRTIVVSNQAGVGRGVMSADDLGRLHEWVAAEARAAGGRIDAFYCCPHDWHAGCDCRKPAPGLLFQAQRAFLLDLTRTPFIGDDERDGEAAARAGCPFLLASSGKPLLELTETLLLGSTEAQHAHP
jgi:D-glycero-D-manno-heptose 1,7-bisphosphate phosphatase